MPARVAVIALLLLAGCMRQPHAKVAPAAEAQPRIQVGSILNCNQLQYYAKPVYSKELRDQHVQGSVDLLVVITRTGEPSQIEVLQGDPRLVPYAVDAVKKWRYSPCILNSEPIEVKSQLSVNFSLRQ